MTGYVLMPDEATPKMEQAAEKYWNERKFKALSDDPRTWKGLYAAMRAVTPDVQGEPVGEAGSLPGARGFTTAVFESSKVPEGTKLYTAPQPAHDVQGEPVDELHFEYRHPKTEEAYTVSLSREEVKEMMDQELFERLTACFCECEPIGETNVVDCRCDEYAEEFELVTAPQTAERQSVLNLSEAARSLGVAQEKGDQGAIDYWSDMVVRFEREVIQPAEEIGEVVVTKDKLGNIVSVTRQDAEGRVLSVIAESDSCDDDCDASPTPTEQSGVAVPEIIEAVANFVGSQKGGPFPPAVIKAAIIGQLEHGDAFTKLFTSPAPSYGQQSKEPAPDVSALVEALELISVTDPNEGVAWFHEIAYRALAAYRKGVE